MPRGRTYEPRTAARAAMMHFWQYGYSVTSIADLVAATGVARHGLYETFSSKQGLFEASVDVYRQDIVHPALLRMKQARGFDGIVAYFEHQFALAKLHGGFPSLGCLIANTSAEKGPHDKAIRKLIRDHNKSLAEAFHSELRVATDVGGTRARKIASVVVVFANGLWLKSRTAEAAEPLRRDVIAFLDLLKRSMHE